MWLCVSTRKERALAVGRDEQERVLLALPQHVMFMFMHFGKRRRRQLVHARVFAQLGVEAVR